MFSTQALKKKNLVDLDMPDVMQSNGTYQVFPYLSLLNDRRFMCELLFGLGNPYPLFHTARPVDTLYYDPVEGSQTFRPTALRPMPPTNSPWRGQWNTPEQFFSTVPKSNKEIPKLQEQWGQIPAFMGPPQDQWIDELDEAYQFQPEGFHRCYTYGSAAFERSLPKFELSKFDGSPMAWPDWISRFKSVVHDQPFLNDNQRIVYLQTLVTSAAKTEIQYLGEDGMSYTLALRILKSRFADAGKIVRAAITQLKNTPSPRTHDHHAIVKLYQALRSAVVTLHRQRFIADLISETNLAIVLEKLPDQLATKWAMEGQKHECYGRPNLFDFDRCLSEQVRCRQHLVHEESVQPITKPKFNARRDNSIRVNTLATSTNHNTTSDGKDKGTGTCTCCKQLHAIYGCNDFTKRIAEIREVSSPRKWRHVPGQQNVADDCSRGLSVEALLANDSRWIAGPSFLRQHESLWPEQRVFAQENDPEVKADSWCAFAFSTDEDFIDPKKVSSYHHLMRVTPWIRRFTINCRAPKHNPQITGPLTLEEIEDAEHLWIKRAQTQAYPEDMARIKAKREISHSSSLKSLNPTLDERDVLRVGGTLWDAKGDRME
ncbi:hypothetical protein QZH41_001579 [Actinostola sp. cb2023]|nr:hypothetical protein QZH41_001579 [Actinostola sp. cb2023]